MSLQKKFKQQDLAIDKHVRDFEKELIRNYQASLKEIRGKLADLYEKTNGSFVEAQKYNRLANLEQSIMDELKVLTGKNAKTLKNGVGTIYEESFFRTAYILENEVQAQLGYSLLNKQTIQKAIENPLDRVGFINRHIEGQNVLARQLRDELAQGLIQGKSYQQTAKVIKERMGVGASKAVRIVQTETNRVRNSAKLDAMHEARDAGVVIKKMWLATVDDKTRDSHADLDGETIELDESFDIDGESLEHPGDPAGSPENVINCRCTMISVIEDFTPNQRRVRDVGVTEYKSFNEWRDNL